MQRDWRREPRLPPSTIGELVKRARLARGLTQYELAQAIGTQPAYVSKIETGMVKQPAMHYLLPLAETLHVPMAALYKAATGKEWGEAPSFDPDVTGFASWVQGLAQHERERVYAVARAMFPDKSL